MGDRSLGCILREERERSGFSLVYVGSVLNIPVRYIGALEDDCFEKLPMGVYGELFIKKYGKFLSLNTDELIFLYKNIRSKNNSSSGIQNDYMKVPISIKRRSMFIISNYIKILLILFCVGILAWYIGSGILMIIKPPGLTIFTPSDNSIVKEKSIGIVGRTDDSAEVYVNDLLVLLNENGDFSSEVNLQNGINVIKIMVRSRHGKERIEYRRVLFENDLSFEL